MTATLYVGLDAKEQLVVATGQSIYVLPPGTRVVLDVSGRTLLYLPDGRRMTPLEFQAFGEGVLR